MSHEATNWAFKVRGLSPAQRLVLLCLADCHNPAHGCFPTQQFIASVCEITPRTVQEHLKELEALGHFRRERITGDHGQRTGTRYILGFEILPEDSSGRLENALETASLPEDSRGPYRKLVSGDNGTVIEPLPPLSPMAEIGYISRTKPPLQAKPCANQASGWSGDPKLRTRVVATMGEPWAKSYLDTCHPLPDGSIIARTGIAFDRLKLSGALRGVCVHPPGTPHDIGSSGISYSAMRQ